MQNVFFKSLPGFAYFLCIEAVFVLFKTDKYKHLNKEFTLSLNPNLDQDQLYIVKLTTNQGSSTRKGMSSR